VGHHTREAKNLLKLRIRVKIRHESGGRRGRSKYAFWVQANFGSFRPVFGGAKHEIYSFLIPPNTPINMQAAAAYLLGPILGNLTSVNFKNGYTMSGNVTLERQLSRDIAVQAAYVSNNAVGLYGPEYPNAYTGAETRYTPYTNVNPGLGEFMLLFLACQVVRFS
jgi:hypothetical protein